jgi:hypothetical protein
VETPFVPVLLCSDTTNSQLLGNGRDSAVPARCRACVSPAARAEIPPSARRASAGYGYLCGAESQKLLTQLIAAIFVAQAAQSVDAVRIMITLSPI